MNKAIYFSPERIFLGKDNWFSFLRILKEELAVFLDGEILETSTFWEEEEVNYASFACNIDIIVNIFSEAVIQYGGVICYSKNYEKQVNINVFLLAFRNGKRIESNSKKIKYLAINYDLEKGWNAPKWLDDVYGEWESYTDMERWI